MREEYFIKNTNFLPKIFFQNFQKKRNDMLEASDWLLSFFFWMTGDGNCQNTYCIYNWFYLVCPFHATTILKKSNFYLILFNFLQSEPISKIPLINVWICNFIDPYFASFFLVKKNIYNFFSVKVYSTFSEQIYICFILYNCMSCWVYKTNKYRTQDSYYWNHNSKTPKLIN